MTNTLSKILDELASLKAPNVFNPWGDADPLDVSFIDAPVDRLTRLRQHFDCEAHYMLIGEAPGYQGCHFSGIPFTNESLLLKGEVPRVDCPMRITTRARPWCEPSATVVWRELRRLDIADHTVMWNAFAWHPHKAGNPYSNRAPTSKELNAGSGVLGAVLNYFDQFDCKYIAVGRVAEAALNRMGVQQFATVRHPSMGGAAQFRQQLASLIPRF